MLVLSLKPGECVVCSYVDADGVKREGTIKYDDRNGTAVRLVFDLPRSFEVLREKLADRRGGGGQG